MTVTHLHNMAQRPDEGGVPRAQRRGLTVSKTRSTTDTLVGTRRRAMRRRIWTAPMVLSLVMLASGCSGLFARKTPAAAPTSGTPTRATTRTRGAASPVATPTSTVSPSPTQVDPVIPEPDAAASDAAGVARLVRLAQVWHTAALHHPWIATRGVPWDSALIIATTRIRSANTSESLIDAYRRTLRVLNDPVSRIEAAVFAPRPPVPIMTEWMGDSVLVVRLSPDAALDAADSAQMSQAMQRAPRRLLLDMRGDVPVNAFSVAQRVDHFLARTGFVRAMVSGTILSPAVRTRQIGIAASVLNPEAQHSGTHSQRLDETDAWQTTDATTYRGAADTPRRVVLLADSGSVLPGVLLAMHDAAQLSLVADGSVSDVSAVPAVRVPVDSAFAVVLRTGELVHLDGSLGVVPDTTLTHSGTTDAARQAAITLVQGGMRLPLAERPLPIAVARAQTPVFYDTTAYPFMGARLLGGFRVWSAMRARHAQRDAYDDDLEAVFERVIPKLEAAQHSVDYAAAIADLATSIDDVTATPSGASYDSAIGDASLPFRLRSADGRVFLTDVITDSTTTRLGIVRGTEVIAVDGYPVGAWLAERRRMAPASNEWSRLRTSLLHLARGREGNLIVKVRDANNRERTLEIPRRAEYRTALSTFERPSEAPIRFLSDGVVYIDVERLDSTSVASAVGRLAAARAVVLDLRGTLTTDDTPLLSRLATQPSAPLAQLVKRVITEPCLASIRDAAVRCTDVRVARLWSRQIDTTNVFTGRVVALIDERTSGAMERFALALEQLGRVTFIGSSSAGSLSVVTPLSLPGGLQVGIATHEMRRADGGQLQRVGLTPAIDVRPSARGIRAGDDDVLMRAQQWVQQQLEPPRRRR